MNKIKDFIKSYPYFLLMIVVCIAFWIYSVNDFEVNFRFLSRLAIFDSLYENGGTTGVADLGLLKQEESAALSDIESLVESTVEPASKEEINISTEINETVDETKGEVNASEEGNLAISESIDGLESTEECQAKEDETPYESAQYPYSFGEYRDGYIYYEPIETNSRYYNDEGRVALTTKADYFSAQDDYFNDACFIGDSRMVGIADYSGWNNAMFFCDNGYCLHSFATGKTVTCQNDGKKYVLSDALDKGSFGKIYVMLGINDCGYGNNDTFRQQYSDMLNLIREKQPNAKIFILSNLRISKNAENDDKTGVYRNVNVNSKNSISSEFADGENVFYLDYNSLFVDEEGYLVKDYTFDGFHVYAMQYMELARFIAEHAI